MHVSPSPFLLILHSNKLGVYKFRTPIMLCVNLFLRSFFYVLSFTLYCAPFWFTSRNIDLHPSWERSTLLDSDPVLVHQRLTQDIFTYAKTTIITHSCKLWLSSHVCYTSLPLSIPWQFPVTQKTILSLHLTQFPSAHGLSRPTVSNTSHKFRFGVSN